MIAALVAVLSFPAYAQSQCAPREKALEVLEKEYGEVPTARGLDRNGNMIELFRTESGSTWTIIITLPNGMSCPGTSGESWESVPLKKTGLRI